MKRSFVLVVSLALLFVPGAHSAGPSVSWYTDPVGDNGPAPDVSGVVVGQNDSRYGLKVFLETDFTAQSILWLFINSDRNCNTGDPDYCGTDYELEIKGTQPAYGWFAWDGRAWTAAPASDIVVSVASDHRAVAVSLDGVDFHANGAFQFSVETSDGTTGDHTEHYDQTPDRGSGWTYDGTNGLSLASGRIVTYRKASKYVWSILMPVYRSDTGTTVHSATAIACSAHMGNTKLQVTGKGFMKVDGEWAAACVYRMVKQHAYVAGTITVSYGGATITRSVAQEP